MFPVGFLHRVPKLYQLKQQCVNTQLRVKQMMLDANFQESYRDEIKVDPFKLFLVIVFPLNWGVIFRV